MNDILVMDMPIEPIETRYSYQWARWFPRAYERAELQYTQIHTPQDYNENHNKFGTSNFLDPMSTFRWKFPQLNAAVSTIQQMRKCDNVKKIVVFLHDSWFPGIECFKYISEMLEIPIGVVGFWHAGSYIPEDPLGWNGLHQWMRGSETSWFKLCDAVCVGSEHHKQMILSSLGGAAHDGDKVRVTGYPVEVPEFGGNAWKYRKNRVVWPHRLSREKHPTIFDLLAEELKDTKWEFVKTLEVCKTKASYYEMLASSKVAVSTSSLETFGIAMVEAALSGCRVLCPDKLSYQETMPQTALYKTFGELVAGVKLAMNSDVRMYYDPQRYAPAEVCGTICNIIKEVGYAL